MPLTFTRNFPFLTRSVITASASLDTSKKTGGNVYDDEAFYGSSKKDYSITSDRDELDTYAKLVWAATCADVISNDVARQRIYFRRVGGGREIPINRLPDGIRQPFERGYFLNSFSDLVRTACIHKLLSGNAYLLKSKTTAYGVGKGIPDTFIPFLPSEVKPVISQDGKWLKHYELHLSSGQTKIAQIEDIVHISQSRVYSPFVGVGNIGKARQIAENEQITGDWANGFVDNMADPKLIVMEDFVGDVDEFERKGRMLKAQNEKRKNSGGIMYIGGKDVKVFEPEISNADMQFLETKQFNRQAIMGIFRVPGPRIALPDSANFATAKAMIEMYLQNEVNGHISELSGQFNHQWVRLIDANIEMVIEPYSITNLDEIIKELQAGIITPDKARELRGRDVAGDDFGGQYFMPSSITPMDQPEPDQPEPTEEMPDDGKTYCCKKPHQDKWIDRMNRTKNRMERVHGQKLSVYLAGQRARVIDGLSKFFGKATDELPDAEILEIVFSLEDENRKLKPITDGLYRDGVNSGIDDVAAVAEKPISISSFQRGAIVANLQQRMVKFNINESARDVLKRVITDAVEQSWSIYDITQAVQDTGFWSGHRASRIARTEANAAWDAAAQAGYLELGVDYVDIVGCTQFEPNSDCGRKGVRVQDMHKLVFHPNHKGGPAPSKEV